MASYYTDPKTKKVDFNRDEQGNVKEGSEGITLPDETWGEKVHRNVAPVMKRAGDLTLQGAKGAVKGVVGGAIGLTDLAEQGVDAVAGTHYKRNEGLLDKVNKATEEWANKPVDTFGSGLKDSQEGRDALSTMTTVGDLASILIPFGTTGKIAKGTVKMSKGLAAIMKTPGILGKAKEMAKAGTLTEASLVKLLEKESPELLANVSKEAGKDLVKAGEKFKGATEDVSKLKNADKASTVVNKEGTKMTLTQAIDDANKAVKSANGEGEKARLVSDLIKGYTPEKVAGFSVTHPKLYSYLTKGGMSGSVAAWIIGKLSAGADPSEVENEIPDDGKDEVVIGDGPTIPTDNDVKKFDSEKERDIHQAQQQRKKAFDKQEAEYAKRGAGLPVGSYGKSDDGTKGVDKRADDANDDEVGSM